MASLYKKNRSPFWYIQYTDPQGVRRNKTTGLRTDSAPETLKAKEMRATLEAKELALSGASAPGTVKWESWVSKYFELHCESPLTLVRYRGAWSWLSMWLQLRHYDSARAITYQKGMEYIAWRTSFKKRSGKTAALNTAIMELKILALVMSEAVRLGHADGNPLANLKIKMNRPAKKPELSDKDVTEILEALKGEEEWMQTTFAIGLNTGCRLRETRIPMNCVKFEEEKITFPSPKGGEDRAFSIPMPSVLRPLFERLRDKGKEYTLDFPFQPSRKWQQFFKKIGKPHLCFHCLRVTYITRLQKMGVPQDQAMRLVNHASSLIHKVYQRENVEDLAKWRDMVVFPTAEPPRA